MQATHGITEKGYAHFMAAAASLERRFDVASFLASGYSVKRAAELCGLAPTTVHGWLENQDFADQVAYLRDEIVDAQADQLMANVAMSQRVISQALTGEIEADAAIVGLAERFFSGTIGKLFNDPEIGARFMAGDYRPQPATTALTAGS